MTDPVRGKVYFGPVIPGIRHGLTDTRADDSPAGWTPDRSPLQRLVQFLDVLAVGLNLVRHKAPRYVHNSRTNSLSADDRQAKLVALQEEYFQLGEGVVRPYSSKVDALDALLDEATAELRRAGHPDTDALAEAVQLLDSLYWCRPLRLAVAIVSDEQDQSALDFYRQAHRAEEEVLGQYLTVRAQLLQVLLSAGLPVPPSVRIRYRDVSGLPLRLEDEEPLDHETLLSWLRDAEPRGADQRSTSQQSSESKPPAPDTTSEVSPKKRKGKNIDAQMLKVMAENPESHGWSLRKWAVHLGCAPSTVEGTKTWRERLKAARAIHAADAASRMDQSHTTPAGRRRKKTR